MRRKTLILVLILFGVAALGEAGMPNPFRRDRSASRRGGKIFPETGDIPGLERTSKVVTYQEDKFQEFYGAAGNRYIQYGLINLMTAEYLYNGPKGRTTIEVATMENPTAAAGLFHYHRGSVLGGRGEEAPVGAEGVLDSRRESRNLYFYRSNMFVKVVYSGAEPVPDLRPIGKFIDEQLPMGRDDRPDGFNYIEIEGVNKDTISLTPGFTFNISFLPPSVWASAPGGGSQASDLFIITKLNSRDAAELLTDYASYLRLHAEYIEEYKRGGQRYVKGVDPNQGRVVATAYRHAFIIAARPDGYERGEALIDRVMARMDEVTPDGKRRRAPAGDGAAEEGRRDDGEKRGFRFNPFRRR